jgi:hypothetical protein
MTNERTSEEFVRGERRAFEGVLEVAPFVRALRMSRGVLMTCKSTKTRADFSADARVDCARRYVFHGA